MPWKAAVGQTAAVPVGTIGVDPAPRRRRGPAAARRSVGQGLRFIGIGFDATLLPLTDNTRSAPSKTQNPPGPTGTGRVGWRVHRRGGHIPAHPAPKRPRFADNRSRPRRSCSPRGRRRRPRRRGIRPEPAEQVGGDHRRDAPGRRGRGRHRGLRGARQIIGVGPQSASSPDRQSRARPQTVAKDR